MKVNVYTKSSFVSLGLTVRSHEHEQSNRRTDRHTGPRTLPLPLTQEVLYEGQILITELGYSLHIHHNHHCSVIIIFHPHQSLIMNCWRRESKPLQRPCVDICQNNMAACYGHPGNIFLLFFFSCHTRVANSGKNWFQ